MNTKDIPTMADEFISEQMNYASEKPEKTPTTIDHILRLNEMITKWNENRSMVLDATRSLMQSALRYNDNTVRCIPYINKKNKGLVEKIDINMMDLLSSANATQGYLERMMAMDGRSERTNFIKNTFKKIWSLESHPVDITLMLFGREYYNTNWENAMEHGFIKQSDDVRDSLRIYIDAVSGIYTEEDIEGLAGHHTGDESKRVWRCDEEKERRIAMYMPIDRVLCLNNLKNDFELLYNKQGLIPGVETNILRAAIDKVNDMYFIESGNYGSHLPDGKQLRSDIWNETPEEHKVPFFVYLPRRIEDISINPIMSVFNNFRGVLETAKNKLIEEKKGPG